MLQRSSSCTSRALFVAVESKTTTTAAIIVTGPLLSSSFRLCSFGAHSKANSSYYDRVDNGFYRSLSTEQTQTAFNVAKGSAYYRPSAVDEARIMPWGLWRDNRAGQGSKDERPTRNLKTNPGTPRTNLKKKTRMLAQIAAEYLPPADAHKVKNTTKEGSGATSRGGSSKGGKK